MKPKDRVKTAFAHREPDRVPIDYAANAEIDQRLREHFGLGNTPDDAYALRDKLGVDFRYAAPLYRGPKLFNPPPDTRVNEWGATMKWIEHAGGGYWDYAGWPLQNATLEEIEAWPMPNPDDYDYDVARRCAIEFEDYFVQVGGIGRGDIINQSGMLRTMEVVLMDLFTDDPAGLRLIDRRQEIELELIRRTLEAVEGRADAVVIGEDLGSQRGPLISMELFRKHFRPRLQRYIDLAREFNLPVMMHSDGSVSWVYPELIDMGVSIVDAVQIECYDMEPASLKRRFGDRLSFHGVWPTTGKVSSGTVDEAVAEAAHVLDVMKPGGGFAFSPAHAIQSISPTENVLAVYEMVRERGRYR